MIVRWGDYCKRLLTCSGLNKWGCFPMIKSSLFRAGIESTIDCSVPVAEISDFFIMVGRIKWFMSWLCCQQCFSSFSSCGREEKREKGRFILSHINNLFTAVCKVIIIMTGTFRKEMTSFFWLGRNFAFRISLTRDLLDLTIILFFFRLLSLRQPKKSNEDRNRSHQRKL